MTTRRLVFRTVHDPSVQQQPERCPWPEANVFLGGRMCALEQEEDLGTAHTCAMIPGPLEPGGEAPFYAEFRLAGGDRYTAEGAARVLSTDVPVPGVALAVAALRLVDGPPDVVGGIVASTSIFNPAAVPGIETGSVWTILAYLRD